MIINRIHFCFIRFTILSLTILGALGGYYTIQISAQNTDLDVCKDARFLLAKGDPFAIPQPDAEDHVLSPGIMVSENLDSNELADYWVLNITNPESAFTINLVAENVEFAVFLGMVPVSDGYLDPGFYSDPVPAKDMVAGIYTIVVRRQHLANSDNLSYTLTANFEGNEDIVFANLKNQRIFEEVSANLQAGMAQFVFPQGNPTVWTHVNGLTHFSDYTPSSQGVKTNQVYSETGQMRLVFDAAFSRIDLLGGDLMLHHTSNADFPRVFYIENANFRNRQNPLYLYSGSSDINITAGPSDAAIKLKLPQSGIRQFWLLNDCVGIEFVAPGTTNPAFTFVSPVSPDERVVTVKTDTNQVTITIDEDRSDQRSISLDYSLIMPGGEVTWQDDKFVVPIKGGRTLELETQDATILPSPLPIPDCADDAAPVNVHVLRDDAYSDIKLDWCLLERFSLTSESQGSANKSIRLTFRNDLPDDARSGKETTRSAADLNLFEEQDRVIRIVYGADGNGEQRLWLPGEESYIELVSPAKSMLPPYNMLAMPNEPGYEPIGMNNMGGECYPANTLLPLANCPPNGHINLANGNLWYAVIDQVAYGDRINLTLTRSYNSRDQMQNGPFGYGWTTTFLLDYPVDFTDSTVSPGGTLSRVVTQEDQDAITHRVGLNLTWAPYGDVELTTPSGSRHLFHNESDNLALGEFEGRAVKRLPNGGTVNVMPGWTLHRENFRSEWVLTLDDGRFYKFDRAGRLTKYGYGDPNQVDGQNDGGDRIIDIEYPPSNTLFDDLLNEGVERKVTISDVAEKRQLELYYDENDHICASVLRDVENTSDLSGSPCTLAEKVGGDAIGCNPEGGCFLVQYKYDMSSDRPHLLTEVIYPYGPPATYEYDNQNRLIGHNDPRAPIAPIMSYTYTYSEDSLSAEAPIVVQAYIGTKDEGTLWQSATLKLESASINNPTQRLVAELVDQHANTFKHVFCLKADAAPIEILCDVDDLYTRIRIEYPESLNIRPTRLEWSQGQLNKLKFQELSSGASRNSIALDYDSNGQLTEAAPVPYVGSDYPPLFRQVGNRVLFGDGSEIAFESSDTSTTFTDRFGESYEYKWVGGRLGTSEFTPSSPSIYPYTNTYVYDDFGLLARQLQAPYGLSETTLSSEVDYIRNNLGYVTEVTLAANPVVHYTIEYLYSCDGFGFATDCAAIMRVQDATESYTISGFDARGQLIATCLSNDDYCQDFMRKTTYEYDTYGRLTAENRWLDNIADHNLVTKYEYDDIAPDGDDSGRVEPNGSDSHSYQITREDAYGRRQTFTYDALDRLERVDYGNGYGSEYTYEAYESDILDIQDPEKKRLVELRLTQKDTFNGDEINPTIIYTFNHRWILKEIHAITSTPDGDVDKTLITFQIPDKGSVNPEALYLGARDYGNPGFIEWFYSEDEDLPSDETPSFGGHPTGIKVNVDEGKDINFGLNYDQQGRITQYVDVNGQTVSLAYCPGESGAYQVLRSMPDESVDCNDQLNVAGILQYDALDRIIEIHNKAFGNCYFRYSYSPDAYEDNGWTVLVSQECVEKEECDFPEGKPAWELFYNSAGDLLRRKDADTGYVWVYDYDMLGRLIQIRTGVNEESLSVSQTFEYNAADLVTQTMDYLRQGYSYTYNAQGQLLTQLNNLNNAITTYVYDEHGRLQSINDPSGKTIEYRYDDPDDIRKPTQIIDGDRIHGYEWNDGTLIYTNPLGVKTYYGFDELGRLDQVDEDFKGDEPKTDYQLIYDSAGHVMTWIQPGGIEQNFGYPSASEPLQSLWVFDFSSANNLLRAGDLSFTYDPFGRLMSLQDDRNSIGTVWTVTRENPGQSPQITVTRNGDPESTTVYKYDELYRVLRQYETNDEGQDWTYEYSPSLVNPGGSPQAGLLIEVKSPSDTQSTYTFRVQDGEAIFRLPEQRETHYQLNENGLITQIQTYLCLDEEGGILGDDLACPDISDYRWNTTERIEYNFHGLPTQVIGPDGNIQTFDYDKIGNLTGYRDVNGRRYHYTYDPLNRLTQVEDPSGMKTWLFYDDAGDLDKVCITDENFELTDCNANQPDEVWMVDFPTTNTTISSELPPAASLGPLISKGDEQAEDERYVDLTWKPVINGEEVSILMRFYVDERGLWNKIEYLEGEDPVHTINLYYGVDGNNELKITFRENPSFNTAHARFNQENEVQAFWGSSPEGIHVTTDNEQTQESERFEIRQISGKAYGVRFGYDQAGRPRSITVLDLENAAVVYGANYYYDRFGRRDTETHIDLYGAQLLIDYTYNTEEQSTAGKVTYTFTPPPDDTPVSAALSAIGLLCLFGLGRKRFRRILPGRNVLLLLAVLSLGTTTLVTSKPPIVFEYTKNDFQTITQITGNGRICASYRYQTNVPLEEGGSRQIPPRLVNAEIGDGTYTYEYDATDRLIKVGGLYQLYYPGDSRTPLLTYDNSQHLAIHMPMMNGWYLTDVVDSQLETLYANKQGKLAVPLLSTNNVEPIIFDPYGRVIPLNGMEQIEDPCSLVTTSPLGADMDDVANLSYLRVSDMIWDPQSNLYFKDNQVYSPFLGRFLQPLPASEGTSLSGDFYVPAADQIPIRPVIPSYRTGLNTLNEALQLIHDNAHSLSAASILQQYRPAPLGQNSVELGELAAYAGQELQTQLVQQMNLPLFLSNAYNLPSVRVDSGTGAIRIKLDHAPANGGWGDAPTVSLNTDIWNSGIWLPTVQSPDASLQRLYEQTQLPLRRVTTYLPDEWQPQLPILQDTWNVAAPVLDDTVTPFAVFAWLPPTVPDIDGTSPNIAGSVNNISLVDLVGSIADPQNAADYADQLLHETLPRMPDVLPQSPSEMLQHWFTYDLWGRGVQSPAQNSDTPFRIGLNPTQIENP